MKLKNLFFALLSIVLMAACADDDNTLGNLNNIVLDKTYVTIPESGGSVTVNVNTKADWQLSELPEWLTANVTSGSAGDTQLVLSAEATTTGGHEAELSIKVGESTQFLMVRQDGTIDVTTATCAEVIAGNDGKTYRVKGTCTTISNTTYGNWYLQDETGEVYIYGTLYNGQEKMFTSLGIEEGDVVEVEGSKTTYNGTVELVNVTVISIEKSLVKVITPEATMPVAGGELQIKVAYKGSGAYPEVQSDCLDWIRYVSTEYVAGEGADTAIVKFNIAPNTGVARTGDIAFKSTSSSTASSVTYTVSQAGVGGTVEKPYTVAEAIQAAQGGTDEVYVKGKICKISSISTSYGNATYYISDDGTDNNSLQIFRGYYLAGEKFTSEDQLKVGDEVIVVGKLKMYSGSPEMDSGNYIYSMSNLVSYVLNYGTDGNTYRLKGTVKSIANTKYGNWYLEDATGQIYIYGTLDADGNTGKEPLTSLGISEGDTVEVEGPRSTYNGTPQLKNVTVLSITKAN